MAETSDQRKTEAEPQPQPDYPECLRERDAREDTELARLRRNYSRASSYPSTGTVTRKPTIFPERFTHAARKFWRRQVSIVVAHSTCRDHLGTFCLQDASAKASYIRYPSDRAAIWLMPQKASRKCYSGHTWSYDAFTQPLHEVICKSTHVIYCLKFPVTPLSNSSSLTSRRLGVYSVSCFPNFPPTRMFNAILF